MIKIAGLTPCLNEEATIIFCVASLLPYVDHYVLVDSGSTDKTLPLVKSIFSNELKSGKLILIEYGALPDYDISKPKNAAIAKIRELGCSRFIRLDADDVFYDAGARKAVETAKTLSDEITLWTINHWELYQNSYEGTINWLYGLLLKDNKFKCLRMPPGANPTMAGFTNRFDGSYGHARIYKTDGAVSIGKWTDEAKGLGPGEDIHHPGMARICKGYHDEDIVHYGWARPMSKKLEKGRIWLGEGKERADPRVDGIEKQWKNVDTANVSRMDYGMKHWPHSIIFPFTKHPEVIGRLVERVIDEFGRIPNRSQ